MISLLRLAGLLPIFSYSSYNLYFVYLEALQFFISIATLLLPCSLSLLPNCWFPVSRPLAMLCFSLECLPRQPTVMLNFQHYAPPPP